MRDFVIAALLALGSASSAHAAEPTPPPPQPTPPPETRPQAAPDTGAPATPEIDPAMPAPAPSPRLEPYFNAPRITPSAAVFIGYPSVWTSGDRSHVGTRDTTFPLWAGMTVHPSPANVSGYVSLGTELAFQPLADRTILEWTPEMRFGAAITAERHPTWVQTAFPWLQVYGIAGYRLENAYRPGATRVGLGVSSPLLGIYVAGASGKCVSPPVSFEGVMDVEHDGTRSLQLRLGWAF